MGYWLRHASMLSMPLPSQLRAAGRTSWGPAGCENTFSNVPAPVTVTVANAGFPGCPLGVNENPSGGVMVTVPPLAASAFCLLALKQSWANAGAADAAITPIDMAVPTMNFFTSPSKGGESPP